MNHLSLKKLKVLAKQGRIPRKLEMLHLWLYAKNGELNR